MQSSLHRWLIGNTKTVNMKISHIFHLDWDENSPTPNKNAVWLNEPVPNHKNKFTKDISWRYFRMPISLSGNQSSTNDTVKIKKNTNIPVLKSNLQKCIRRGITQKALSTSVSMIQIDFIEFIRRISIIMLEDCILHESFPTLVWMTAAYPEWKPNQNHINWLLGIVKHLSDLDRRDLVKREDFDFKKNIKEINSLDIHKKSLIYSLYFRVSYGGMQGDMNMLKYFADLWLKRFQNNSKFNNYLYKKIEPVTIPILPIEALDIKLCAIDFHCYPQMLSILNKKYENNIEDIRRCIWFHSSRNTNKNLLDGNDDYKNEYLDLWNTIKMDVKRLSFKYRADMTLKY